MRVSQCRVKQIFDYHPDGYLLRKLKGGRLKRAGSVKEKIGYEQVGLDNKVYMTHRLIFLWHHGYLPDMIDHINQNSLDNRIENLRECTNSINQMNSRGSNGHKNVYRYNGPGQNNWSVKMMRDGKMYYGGYFKTLDEAKKKAEEMRNEIHGEYACNSI